MANMAVRDVEDEVRDDLRILAAEHGRSMEAEVRAALREYTLLRRSGSRGFGSRIRARFEGVDTSDFEAPPRTDMPRAAEFNW